MTDDLKVIALLLTGFVGGVAAVWFVLRWTRMRRFVEGLERASRITVVLTEDVAHGRVVQTMDDLGNIEIHVGIPPER